MSSQVEGVEGHARESNRLLSSQEILFSLKGGASVLPEPAHGFEKRVQLLLVWPENGVDQR